MVREDERELDRLPCAVCGSYGRRPLYEMPRRRLVECRDCGHEYGVPMPAGSGERCFYLVAWNVLCGSVIHAHSQVTLSAGFAEGGVQGLARGSRHYARHHGASLFEDLARVHEALGLATRHGEAVAFASLTPVKERETWLLGSPGDACAAMPEDLERLLCHVLARLVASCEAPRPALNIAVAFPPLRPVEGWEEFPIVARVVDRGWPLLGVADWGTMEMYGTRVVAADPFAVAQVLKQGPPPGEGGAR